MVATFLLLDQVETTPTLAPSAVMESNGGLSVKRSVVYREPFLDPVAHLKI